MDELTASKYMKKVSHDANKLGREIINKYYDSEKCDQEVFILAISRIDRACKKMENARMLELPDNILIQIHEQTKRVSDILNKSKK